MTDRPYTEADLRAEAAACLNALSIPPTTGDIHRSLPGTYIDSHRTDDGGATWDDLLDSAGMGTAVGKIHALIDGAADTSAWAIALGAADLKPIKTHGWRTVGSGWDVAIQIATSPQLTDKARDELAEEISKAIEAVVQRVLCVKPA